MKKFILIGFFTLLTILLTTLTFAHQPHVQWPNVDDKPNVITQELDPVVSTNTTASRVWGTDQYGVPGWQNSTGGVNGTNGISIINAQINATGWLNVTLSNTTVLGPWNVTGVGIAGTNGTNGINGTNGTNGTPDYNISNMSIGTLDGNLLPTISTTKLGGVPATGTPSGKYLKDDDTWDTPTGGSGLTHPQVMSRISIGG
jgi:hypothetical protein